MTSDSVPSAGTGRAGEHPASAPRSVVVARTGQGWRVFAPGWAQDVDDLLEGLSLADLVAEELGCPTEPDRAARRAARAPASGDATPVDPRDTRIAALERTVAQLEHALAARVVTERAIGALAERHTTTPRAAFEVLRVQARSLGRPVHELAREVMATLDRLAGPAGSQAAAAPDAVPDAAQALAPVPRSAGQGDEHPARPGPAVPADGRP